MKLTKNISAFILLSSVIAASNTMLDGLYSSLAMVCFVALALLFSFFVNFNGKFNFKPYTANKTDLMFLFFVSVLFVYPPSQLSDLQHVVAVDFIYTYIVYC